MIKSSGLVGLSPNHFDKESDLFIMKMKETGAIEAAIFSLSIGFGNIQSMITFGGYDYKRFATGPIRWHNANKSSRYWQLELQELTFKDKDKYLKDHFKNRPLIVDSGTSFIMIPKIDLLYFIKFLKVTTGMDCTIVKIPECICN